MPIPPDPSEGRPDSGPNGPKGPVHKQAQAMGQKVGGGMAWLTIATAVVKAASLVNMAILGILLAKEDFGIFGTAIGVAALINVLRDGGVRRILIQKGRHRYPGLVGPIYAWTLLLNILAAAILCALGPAMAAYHKNDQYVMVMVTLGLAALIYGPSMIYQARLSMEYRYKAVATMNASSAIVRYIAMISLALAGAGPLTFTWSLVIIAAYEWLFGLCVTRDPLIRFKPRFRLWPAIWARAKWLLLGALALALLRQGDYLVLGMILEPRIMGIYVFAYMIGDQVMALLASNLQQVLMPTMAAFQHDRERHVKAILRAAGALVMVAAIFAGGIAVTIRPLEQLLWDGKWASAVPAVQALSLCFALRLLVSLQESALSSTGRFRTQFHALLVQGLGMATVAGLGGLFFPDNPGAIAMAIGLWFVVGVTGMAAWSLGRIGVRQADFLRAVLKPWALLTGIALLVIAADLWLIDTLTARALEPDAQDATHPMGLVLRAAISAMAYGLLALLAIRVALPNTLRDLLAIAPGKVTRLAGPLLRM
ncbi:MAG: oligosaccharide flippase family protein [Phycisphaeraceae bacterium]|nr:oligosaccharide flippase family protein [Phycisphaeraceae bacterium]